MISPSTPAHPLDAAIAAVSEFPERLGPVLIKELRQGLRSGMFVLPFTILPALLALVAVWALSIDNVSEARSGVTVCFWSALLVPLLIITPLRALSTIRSEREAQTLDLLQLTPLTAWRIVFAKWSSLMAQALLWVAALLPFFVLRYFFGGMNLVEEGLTLVWFVVFAGVFTAFGL
ncbi:MAG: ABC transporter permease, partial [Gemmatimonadota bacterium]|nr:ABC transporter permease [Gemmatimonadota bacterium]